MARLLWEHPADPKFMRYLHRIKMPTLIVWGDEDKIIPVQQTETWRKFMPNADIQVFKGAGPSRASGEAGSGRRGRAFHELTVVTIILTWNEPVRAARGSAVDRDERCDDRP